MVQHLSMLVEGFPGASNQTRCFNHILNLSAKSILRQFDAPKKAKVNNRNPEDLDVDDAMKALTDLAQELELEPVELDDDESGDEIGHGNDKGMGDDRDGLSDEEVAELETTLVPIRLMLAKVKPFQTQLYYLILIFLQLRTLANAIKNSSTILLPQWNAKLEELGLNVRIMPRDVSTRWNSTFDMLNFAIDYRTALDAMTSNRDLNLRKYELEDDEWAIAEHLRDTLKVSHGNVL
jgi:hypothetical protein